MRRGHASIVVGALSAAWAVACAVAACSEPYEGVTPPPPVAAADGSAADAGAEEIAPLDAPASGFCATLARKSVLCADFDDRPLTDLFPKQGGRVFIDDSVAVSAPRSLRAIGAGSFVERTFDTSPRPPYVVSLAMRIGIPDGGAPPPDVLLPIRFQDDGVADCSFNLEITPFEAYVSVAATVSDGGRGVRTYPIYKWPQAGAWSKIRLEVSNGIAAARVALAVDDIPVLPLTDTYCPSVSGQPKLTLGVVFGDGADVSFDNVIVEGN